MFWRLLCWVVVWLCLLLNFAWLWNVCNFPAIFKWASIFYLKLPPSFGEEYLKNQYCSLITDTTVSLECVWTKSQIGISESWGPQIWSILFRWDVSLRVSLVVFSKAGCNYSFLAIEIRQEKEAVFYREYFMISLCWPFAASEPWASEQTETLRRAKDFDYTFKWGKENIWK